jgi:hypothetical protein
MYLKSAGRRSSSGTAISEIKSSASSLRFSRVSSMRSEIATRIDVEHKAWCQLALFIAYYSQTETGWVIGRFTAQVRVCSSSRGETSDT